MSSVQRVCLAMVDARSPAMVAVFGSFCCGASAAVLHSNSSAPSRCEDDEGDPDTGRRESAARGKRAGRDPPVHPCAKYNSLKWRMSYASRKEDCNAETSCVFIGRNITGACAPRDPSILHERPTATPLPNVPIVLPDDQDSTRRRKAALRRQQTVRNVGESIEELETELKEEKEEDDKAAAKRFREIMGTLDVEESTQELALAILKEEGMQAVQVFVKSQLANAAAEELRYQEYATKAFAKDFLMQVLRNPELPGQTGRMLESMFKDPDLSSGIRHLIYGAIRLDQTFQNTLWLTRNLVTWLLTETDWMDDEAAKLGTYILGLQSTEDAAAGLVAWAIDEKYLDGVASKALADSLPYSHDQLKETMIWAATETLKSDWALKLAKDTVIEMIKSKTPVMSVSPQSPSPTGGGDGGGGDEGNTAADNALGVDGVDDVSASADEDAVEQNSQESD